tara:strand:- start:2662 stop:3075 length:414 start_codon:yes stop_codon:yes gene_type:complete
MLVFRVVQTIGGTGRKLARIIGGIEIFVAIGTVSDEAPYTSTISEFTGRLTIPIGGARIAEFVGLFGAPFLMVFILSSAYFRGVWMRTELTRITRIAVRIRVTNVLGFFAQNPVTVFAGAKNKVPLFLTLIFRVTYF